MCSASFFPPRLHLPVSWCVVLPFESLLQQVKRYFSHFLRQGILLIIRYSNSNSTVKVFASVVRIGAANTETREKERKWKFKVSLLLCRARRVHCILPRVCVAPPIFSGCLFPGTWPRATTVVFYALSFFFFPFTSLPLSLLRFSPVKARSLSPLKSPNLENEPQKRSVSFYLAVEAPSSCFFSFRSVFC